MLRLERRSNCETEPAFWLALLYTVGFFGFLTGLFYLQIPQANLELLKQMLPVLSMIQGGIIQYFYQRSKDQAVQDLTKTAINTAAATPVPATGGQITTDTLDVTANTATLTEKTKE